MSMFDSADDIDHMIMRTGIYKFFKRVVGSNTFYKIFDKYDTYTRKKANTKLHAQINKEKGD